MNQLSKKIRIIARQLFFVGVICILLYAVAYATQEPLSHWQFKREEGVFSPITLPHSTNSNETDEYYKGTTYYKTNIASVLDATTYIVSFEGASQTAMVNLNGKLAGKSNCG